ncbi:MAG: FAD-dependent oxidoreductase [Bacteroidota bacterium]
MQYDFLIVGQGLAGTTLAHQLYKRGLSFQIIDNNADDSTSKVAAGLFNPITGRKFVKTWKADLLFPYLNEFYSELENELKDKFYFPIGIYRPFVNTEEQNDWTAKSYEPEYSSFISKSHSKTMGLKNIKDPFGGILLKYSGYLDTRKYLSSSRAFFQEKHSVLEKSLRVELFETFTEESPLFYEGNKYDKVVLCDGNGALSKSLFEFLPFQPVKGEILELNLNHNLNFTLNRGVWIVPVDNNKVKVGSTYSWEIDSGITAKAREEILEKYKKLYDSEFSIIKQLSGIRPATKDRRPFIGIHPKNHRLGIFNGLGSKGTSLAPYFSSEMVDFLLDKKNLTPEVDIMRYFI